MPASDRRTARLVGWLFIGTFVFAIPGYLLYGPVLDHPDYVLGAGHDTQIALGAFLEILTAICNIGTAIALYPVAKRYAERAALGYVVLFGIWRARGRKTVGSFVVASHQVPWYAVGLSIMATQASAVTLTNVPAGCALTP